MLRPLWMVSLCLLLTANPTTASLPEGHPYVFIDEEEIDYIERTLPNATASAVIAFLYNVAGGEPVEKAWDKLTENVPTPALCHGFRVDLFPPGFVQFSGSLQDLQFKIAGAGVEYTFGETSEPDDTRAGLGYYWAYHNRSGGSCSAV